jgi:hypothetical protein
MRANNPPSKNKLKRPFELELLPNKRLLKAAALTDSVVVAAAVVAAVVEVEVDDMTTDRYQMSENKVENVLYSNKQKSEYIKCSN